MRSLLLLRCLLATARPGKLVAPSGGRLEFLRERLYLWVMMPTSKATATMIPYFAQHYEQLGVDTRRRVTVLLHRAPAVSDAVNAEVMTALRDAFDVPSYDATYVARFSVVSEYSSDIKRQQVNAWLHTLPADAFVVYADLDEFFEYPLDIEDQISLGGDDDDDGDDEKKDSLLAFMMERVGANFTFPALRDVGEGVSIEEQFPLMCRTRERFRGNDQKHSLFAVVDRQTGERRQFNSSHKFQGEDRSLRWRPGVDFAHYAYIGGPDGFMHTLAVKYESKLNTTNPLHIKGRHVYDKERQIFEVTNADEGDDDGTTASSVRHYEISLTDTGKALFRGVCHLDGDDDALISGGALATSAPAAQLSLGSTTDGAKASSPRLSLLDLFREMFGYVARASP
mmetsp:Transcript_14524/g.47330  ORF Transcript_14524/g.47330 Transcript_14524/m.47330 type:complete len:397 (+) Transcript_14524:179-1369(+)